MAGPARVRGRKRPGNADRCRSVDVALSMFVLEHIVFPQRFLNEAWRVLKTGGRLFIISPDFALTPMASERLGLSYGSGRDKLRRGRVWDAILTGYHTRIRIPLHRRRRLREIARGQLHFPVLLQPRCLTQDGFTVDCDAVYPSCPEDDRPFFEDGAISPGPRSFTEAQMPLACKLRRMMLRNLLRHHSH